MQQLPGTTYGPPAFVDIGAIEDREREQRLADDRLYEGLKLAAIRIAAGLTVQQLAAASDDETPETIAALEAGEAAAWDERGHWFNHNWCDADLRATWRAMVAAASMQGVA